MTMKSYSAVGLMKGRQTCVVAYIGSGWCQSCWFDEGQADMCFWLILGVGGDNFLFPDFISSFSCRNDLKFLNCFYKV
jgi:hypothetical protein